MTKNRTGTAFLLLMIGAEEPMSHLDRGIGLRDKGFGHDYGANHATCTTILEYRRESS